jgi:ribosomal protein S18 acetylase RimI-like enzyme
MPGFVQDRGVADCQWSGMQPLSRLPPADIALLRQLVAGDDLVRFYLALAEAEAARGEDASLVMLGRARRGAALGARFDAIAVFSIVGELDDADLSALLDWPGRLELHLTDLHHARIGRLSGQGLGLGRRMVAMEAPTRGAAPDPEALLLDAAGFAAAAATMARHNSDSVLSAHMADLPFAVIRAGDRILAMAGTIGIAGDTALLGHFLTVPEARGRGLARRLALHLRWHFAHIGVARLLLATTEDNAAACRAYTAAGFRVIARRWQIHSGGGLRALTARAASSPPPPVWRLADRR